MRDHDTPIPGKGHLSDKTSDELQAEINYWKTKITNATAWGAALSAAHEFQKDAERELERRRPKGNPSGNPPS